MKEMWTFFIFMMAVCLVTTNPLLPFQPALDNQNLETSRNIINQVFITINLNNTNNTVIPVKLEDFQKTGLQISGTNCTNSTTAKPPTPTSPPYSTTRRPSTTHYPIYTTTPYSTPTYPPFSTTRRPSTTDYPTYPTSTYPPFSTTRRPSTTDYPIFTTPPYSTTRGPTTTIYSSSTTDYQRKSNNQK